MVEGAQVTYDSRPDATADAERNALAAVYRFILDCQAKKRAASPSRPDDGTKVKEDSASARLPHPSSPGLEDPAR